VRPNSTTDRSAWRGNGESFPSGHTTAAFAAAQVFSDRTPPGEWGWRVLAYGLATATAYARVKDNVHWTSDVVAGAALGMATGRFVSDRDATSRSNVSFSVQPLDRGAMLTVSITPR
jgi:membrane-associated phospholipid phosphatase